MSDQRHPPVTDAAGQANPANVVPPPTLGERLAAHAGMPPGSSVELGTPPAEASPPGEDEAKLDDDMRRLILGDADA